MTNLRDVFMADLKSAMRERDVERREAIRMLRAAVLNEEIERQRSLDDGEIVRVVERLVKRHHDSIEQFEKGGRQDLVAHERAQLAAIQRYLPERMARDEVESRVRAAIAETGASGRAEAGKVMARLAGELRGRADLKEVNQLVQELLAS